MLRLPIHGFAKRVDDAVARAMSALQAREQLMVKRSQIIHDPQRKELAKKAGSSDA